MKVYIIDSFSIFSGIMRRALSCNGLVPWSRLSFGISLLQFLYITYAYMQVRPGFHFKKLKIDHY